MSINNNSEIKKDQNIRIKDLCPEEKRKIGELLKKLSNETEEKEKLQSMLQEDKKLYEEKIKTLETSLLQQSMMSTSNFNDLKTENCRQFSIERTPKKTEEKIIKNKLKEKVLQEKINDNNNSNINNIKENKESIENKQIKEKEQNIENNKTKDIKIIESKIEIKEPEKQVEIPKKNPEKRK